MQKTNITSKLILSDTFVDGCARFAELQGRAVGADPLILVLEPEETTLGIEPIRELQGFLSQPPSGELHRLVFIGPAGKITQPAQQALLKLLEEPPQKTEICLVAQAKSDVLPTILSRCIVVDLKEKGEGGESAFLLPFSQAQSLKAKIELLSVIPAQRDAAQDFLKTELKLIQKEPMNRELVAIQQKTLEVLEALPSNVTPALCFDQFLLL